MNITYRKMAMVDKTLTEREEAARIGGYLTDPSEREFHNRITKLLDQVRVI